MNNKFFSSMKRALFLTTCLAFLASFSACTFNFIDRGPYEEVNQSYALADFDQLDMGSAFNIEVKQGTSFHIDVRGNRSDVDDLDVYTRNGVLYAKYRNSRSRRYTTYFTITMPTVRGVDFSGASKSTISGFTNLRNVDITLSGASKSTVDLDATNLTFDLSGASTLDLLGQGSLLDGELSGASHLEAFDYAASDATLDVSGASRARVSVSRNLDVTASGASNVRYRGNPSVRQNTSGASSVQRD